jgi:triosephosphate isomerase
MANRYLIANWKMNLPPEGVEPYLAVLTAAEQRGTTLVVAPPFPYLRDAAGRGSLPIAGQNAAAEKSGAFTGEVSATMLRDCGASHVILGHSERRSLYGDSDAIVARKLALAIESGLTPVLCIGEDLRTRDAGDVETFLSAQLEAVAAAIQAAGEIIVAYEPIWAIGTGRNASGVMVAETVAGIRAALARFWPDTLARNVSVLYGGSVTPDNVGDLVANGAIDGFLVGGASLSSEKFLAIQKALDAGAESGKNAQP